MVPSPTTRWKKKKTKNQKKQKTKKLYRSDCIFASLTAAFSLSLVAFTPESNEARVHSLPEDGVTELGVTFWEGVVIVCIGVTACECVTSDVNRNFEGESTWEETLEQTIFRTK